MKKALAGAALSLCVVAGGFGAVESPAAGSARPSLRLVDQDPIVVRGAHFRAGEVVLVTSWLGERKAVRRVRSSSAGRFVVRIPGRARVGPCSAGLKILAVGQRGSRAALSLPQAACPPGPVP